MKSTAKTFYWHLIITLLPITYLWASWSTLPDNVPLHFNINNEADRYGSKIEFLFVIGLLTVVTLGISLLILNINKIDPKKKMADKSNLMKKVSWILVLFMNLLAFFIIYQTINYTQTNVFSGKYITLTVSLLFMALGNLMNNVKPNYFVGIRTPWTLENEDNWRKTHHLGSKLWFFGGLIIAVLVLVLPQVYSTIVMIAGVLILAFVPMLYSFLIFKKNNKQ